MIVVAGYVRVGPANRAAALDAHFGTPHVVEFAKAARQFGVKEMHIQHHYVERDGPLCG
jgi:2-succinyl-5-enolpyruvyl-6-hydroxy-3-cyclohexene-1-carboxylate synthase